MLFIVLVRNACNLLNIRTRDYLTLFDVMAKTKYLVSNVFKLTLIS